MPSSANVAIGSAVLTLNAVDVGFTRGGITIRYERTVIDIEADQADGTIRKSRSSEKMFVVVNLLEITLENLRLAMMLPTSALVAGVLTLGSNDACFTDEVAITVVGPRNGACDIRTFAFTRGVVIGNIEYMFKRDDAVELKLEFEVLKDDTTGVFGTITDA